MDPSDERLLRRAFTLVEESVALGDQPFGALLAGPDSVMLEARQERGRTGDATAHAEMLLVRRATMRWTREELGPCTLYSSTEPCAMCSGAFAWSGIGRLVYGLSQAAMYAAYEDAPPPRFRVPPSCRALLATVQPSVTVEGPHLEAEGLRAQRLFAAAPEPPNHH